VEQWFCGSAQVRSGSAADRRAMAQTKFSSSPGHCAAATHGEHKKRPGERDENWPAGAPTTSSASRPTSSRRRDHWRSARPAFQESPSLVMTETKLSNIVDPRPRRFLGTAASVIVAFDHSPTGARAQAGEARTAPIGPTQPRSRLHMRAGRARKPRCSFWRRPAPSSGLHGAFAPITVISLTPLDWAGVDRMV
jgi:hypothetical protein